MQGNKCERHFGVKAVGGNTWLLPNLTDVVKYKEEEKQASFPSDALYRLVMPYNLYGLLAIEHK